MNLPDVLGLASTVHEPIFVPVVDAWAVEAAVAAGVGAEVTMDLVVSHP